MSSAQLPVCRRDRLCNILEEYDCWLQAVGGMAIGAGVEYYDSRNVEMEMNRCVDFDVGSLDAAVDEQC